MSDHEQQQPAPRRGKVLEALARAERKVFTRPAPKSAQAQVKFQLMRAKGATQALAECVGVSGRTVERYRAGKLTTPQKCLQAALVEETESEWQPQVRAQAREQASTSTGMMVDVTTRFGFTCKGSSDDGRERSITTAISPYYAKQILELQEAGATEEDLHPIAAQAITESYFTDWGTRAAGLRRFHRHLENGVPVLTRPNSGPAGNVSDGPSHSALTTARSGIRTTNARPKMTTPWPPRRTAGRPLAPHVAVPRESVDPARIGRRVVRRRAKGMDAGAVAAALEDAHLDARQDSRHADLVDDVRGRADLAEWERLDQPLAAAPPGTVYDPESDDVVQTELAAEAAAAADRRDVGGDHRVLPGRPDAVAGHTRSPAPGGTFR
ncbi:hypothetical protein ABZ567_30640 [Streptomyces sp. NPDC016459]|uniref:telomere-protecting terminal protein Tpg n=1 Tax=Streptomyces sp. NPDC016459 TaxID=3157190 RepID=UPI0033FFEADF